MMVKNRPPYFPQQQWNRCLCHRFHSTVFDAGGDVLIVGFISKQRYKNAVEGEPWVKRHSIYKPFPVGQQCLDRFSCSKLSNESEACASPSRRFTTRSYGKKKRLSSAIRQINVFDEFFSLFFFSQEPRNATLVP